MKFREKELLDFNEHKIDNETKREKVLRKKIIIRVFKYLTRNVGKGENSSIKWLHEKDNKRRIINTFLDLQTIENKLINFNQRHYKKVMEILAYKDKLHDRLKDDDIRNKILEGTLSQRDCNNDEIFKFIQLLKNLNFHLNNI